MFPLWILTVLLGCRGEILEAPPFVDPAPSLRTDGLFHGPWVLVQGEATGLTDVTVNGAPVTLDGDTYTVQVPLERGVNTLVLQGFDGRGDVLTVQQDVLSGAFDGPDARIDQALTLRVNQSGFDAAAQIVEDQVEVFDVQGGLAAINPVYSDTYGAFGIDAVTLNANIAAVQFDRPALEINPDNGVLALDLLLPYLDVGVNVTGTVVGIGFDQDVFLGCDAVRVGLDVDVDASSNGGLQVRTLTPTVQLDGFWIDVALLPDRIDRSLLQERVRLALEAQVLTIMEDLLPELLATQLATLELSMATDVLGRHVSVGGFLQDVTIDDQGLQLTSALELSVSAGLDTGTAGYLVNRGSTPSPTRSDDLSIALADDVLNNLFFQIWRSGLLQRELDSSRGEIDPALLADLGAQGSARVIIDARMPPVLIEQNRRPVVQIGELMVRVETPGGDKGEFIELAVTGTLGLDLRVEGGVLKLALLDPDLRIDVRDNGWQVMDNTLTRVLSEQLPIAAMISLFGYFEFPLPTLDGLTLTNAQTFRDASGSHTAIGANL